ncbi:MAG: formyltetrahydrofolate deformylase, partial [Helicobacteraceae bacterium]|nr:formyltetrahydrofolate deformylase [Candidatus Sulfurimonas ponti]
MSQYRVLIDANDAVGIVHKVSTVFYNHNLNILSNNEFVDKENNKFFMRSVVDGDIDLEELRESLVGVLSNDASIDVIQPQKKNIIIMATKEMHALGDILIRHEAGELEANILCVISNYNQLESLVSKFDIPYITISHENLSREEHENKIIDCINSYDHLDYIVLAKYMRILTPMFVETFEDKIINIHHSFLPAFIGANPYKQAYDRGVKIIGATSHFVNNNLDEGPIIAQEVIHVDHAYSWKDMQR